MFPVISFAFRELPPASAAFSLFELCDGLQGWRPPSFLGLVVLWSLLDKQARKMSQKNWEALEVQYYSSKDPKSIKDFALALK